VPDPENVAVVLGEVEGANVTVPDPLTRDQLQTRGAPAGNPSSSTLASMANESGNVTV